MTIQIFRILVGGALLFLGRQLYWLFVAGIGFAATADLVIRLTPIESTVLVLVIALGAGLIGALLALFLQKFAVGLAGFLAGGYVLLALLDLIGLQQGALSWILAVIGGALGVVLILALFEWALIILSSLTGAGMIAQTIDLNQPLTAVLFVGMVIVGIVAQATTLSRGERSSH